MRHTSRDRRNRARKQKLKKQLKKKLATPKKS